MTTTNLFLITFISNVEEAIQTLPSSEPESPVISYSEPSTPQRKAGMGSTPLASPHAGEESAHLLALPTPAQTLSHDARRLLQKTGDTISKPLNAIGRIFSDALDGAEGKLSYLPGPFAPFELGREGRSEVQQQQGGPEVWVHPSQYPQTPVGGGEVPSVQQTPYKQRVRRAPSPSILPSPGSPGFPLAEETPTRHGAPYTHQALSMGPSQSLSPSHARVQSLSEGLIGTVSRTPTPILDIAGMQAEIDMAHEQAAAAARETLFQIFPGVDKEVVEWVLEANEGDLGKSIEGLLEMSSGT
jgi:hypothetical protein